MVCYMYYTDVFVGQTGKDNIDNLKNALNAELKVSELTDELDKLADGLESFIGYDSGRLTGKGIGNNAGGSQKYASSYSNATWEKLCQNCKCKSVSKPSRCSCPSCGSSLGSSVCDPSKCCENCDVRKAAKIFLGMLPCLYYALKYLYDKCEGDWNALNIQFDSKGNGSNDLTKFLHGMGFTDKDSNTSLQGSSIPGLLTGLFTSPKGPLEKLYEKSKNYFTSRFTSRSHVSSPSDSKTPSTVREILLWLSGLPFIPGFKDLLNHCKGLCKPVSSLNFDDFETSLFNSCFLSPFVLGAIEVSKSDESEGFPPYASEISKFSYPEDPFALLETLFLYVRKIYIPLTFFYFQCERPSDQAGWRECYFGKSCQTTGTFSPSPSGCKCKGHETYLCTKDHSGCSGSSSGSCPHPLQRFLIDDPSDSDSQSQSPSSPFRLPFSFAQLDFSQTPPAILDASSDKDFLTMGFKTEQLPSPGRNGRDLYDVLNLFCGSGTSPLTKLFEFSLFVAMRPPETLIELIAFFLRFRLNLGTDPLKDFVSYASKEPGTPDGSDLKTALENLYDFSGHRGSGSHPYDLWSLVGCSGPKGSSPTCGRYLYPLYNINGVFTKEFCDLYLSFVCHLAPKLKALLQIFHEKAKEKFSSCCLSSSSGSSCPSIVTCPCALPFLYSFGFSFWSPNDLNCPGHEGHTSGQGQDQYCTRKTCKNFLEQLGKVLQSDAPLGLLINAIDAFLWSIRLPFIYAFLYIWIIVISYFYYVQFYKLDLLHIDSHLHLPKSFKILPSTLFSDASSKL
ncbi:variant erythrocyte surface antigen-1 family protein, partial [Babesia divergens]